MNQQKSNNPNRKHLEVLNKYRARYNPYQKSFVEIDNMQREFAIKLKDGANEKD